MATGSPLMPRTHLPSHWVSWGQTRPQTAGRLEDWAMIWYAASKLPSATSLMKSGMRIFTGQPPTQGLCLQFRQRLASSMAVSGV